MVADSLYGVLWIWLLGTALRENRASMRNIEEHAVLGWSVNFKAQLHQLVEMLTKTQSLQWPTSKAVEVYAATSNV